MKIGDKIPCVLVISSVVEDGEKVTLNGQTLEVSNMRGNKFWATAPGSDQKIMVCCDPLETEARQICRKAMVDLLETGVGF